MQYRFFFISFLSLPLKFCLLIVTKYFNELIVALVISLFVWKVVLYQQRLQWQLSSCQQDLLNSYRAIPSCCPSILRLAWADASSYNKHKDHANPMGSSWPRCGGCNGSIRFEEELSASQNRGLNLAIEILKPLKKKYCLISWADLIQLSAAVVVEFCDGPALVKHMKFGRIDATDYLQTIDEDYCNASDRNNSNSSGNKTTSTPTINGDTTVTGNSAYPDGAKTADIHLRNVFLRMGFDAIDIVALCGAHTIGRAFANRTGVCKYYSGDSGATKYTISSWNAKSGKAMEESSQTYYPGLDISKLPWEGDGDSDSNSNMNLLSSCIAGRGVSGGCSWTTNWLTFDNSYFKRKCQQIEIDRKTKDAIGTSEQQSDQLLWLDTDQALIDCPEFRVFFLKFAADQNEFFRAYQSAHIRMSEVGAKFKSSAGIVII